MYGYPEIICGTMIARQIFDKLLALPAVLTHHAQALDNPAGNSPKRKRSPGCEYSARFRVRIASHGELPIWIWVDFPCLSVCHHPITAWRSTIMRIAPLRCQTTNSP
jgi:hypothetical protein